MREAWFRLKRKETQAVQSQGSEPHPQVHVYSITISYFIYSNIYSNDMYGMDLSISVHLFALTKTTGSSNELIKA